MPTALTDAKWKRFLLLCASGALTGLMLVFTKLGFLEWITLVPMCVFLLLEIDSDKRGNAAAYGYGFVFFMSFYTVVFHWFINLPNWLIPKPA